MKTPNLSESNTCSHALVLQRTALPSKNLTASESPLFVAPFEPEGDQLTGLHEIRITVHFDDGSTHQHVHR